MPRSSPSPQKRTVTRGRKLDVGSKRLVDGVTDATLSRRVYAQRGQHAQGPLVNQADFLPDLANPSFQDHANEPIHRFIPEIATCGMERLAGPRIRDLVK